MCVDRHWRGYAQWARGQPGRTKTEEEILCDGESGNRWREDRTLTNRPWRYSRFRHPRRIGCESSRWQVSWLAVLALTASPAGAPGPQSEWRSPTVLINDRRRSQCSPRTVAGEAPALNRLHYYTGSRQAVEARLRRRWCAEWGWGSIVFVNRAVAARDMTCPLLMRWYEGRFLETRP